MAKIILSEKEIQLIRIVQEDIPVSENPYQEIAMQLGVNATWVLDTLNSFRERKIMRQFRGILYHQNAGFKANGMSVWKVPEDQIDRIGEQMAQFPEVSHCYHRPELPGWPYRLYGMIHGHSKVEVEVTAQRISRTIEIDDYQILYSTREFKKQSMKYFVGEVE